MAEKREARNRANAHDRELKALARKYEKAMAAAAERGTEQLELARRLFELAIESEGARLMTVEHPLEERGKPIVKHYALTDPRAALLLLWRFCDIWLPIPALVCTSRGCPAFNPPVPPQRIGCFLIECAVNVCPAPGAPRFMCIYLCI